MDRQGEAEKVTALIQHLAANHDVDGLKMLIDVAKVFQESERCGEIAKAIVIGCTPVLPLVSCMSAMSWMGKAARDELNFLEGVEAGRRL